jgi:hypothetical protein
VKESSGERLIRKTNSLVSISSTEMIENPKAKLGTFCRWTLGMEDGVEGLEVGEKEKKDVKMER